MAKYYKVTLTKNYENVWHVRANSEEQAKKMAWENDCWNLDENEKSHSMNCVEGFDEGFGYEFSPIKTEDKVETLAKDTFIDSAYNSGYEEDCYDAEADEELKELFDTLFMPIPNQIRKYKKEHQLIGGKVVLRKKHKVVVSFLDVNNNRFKKEFNQLKKGSA